MLAMSRTSAAQQTGKAKVSFGGNDDYVGPIEKFRNVDSRHLIVWHSWVRRFIMEVRFLTFCISEGSRIG